MSKYTEEFKLKVVKYCLEENHSRPEAEKYFSIPKKSGIKMWIRKYQEHGIEGLVKKQKSSYRGEFKQNVVEYMQSNHLSATEAAIHFNLGSGSVVSKWERIYYEEGPQALYEERRGRSKNMNSKPKNKKLDKEIEKDLIAEVQHLRMENEYLKKLNALVQERIKREGKKK
ncbi:MAG: transposase [Clostridiales bacterium]|nr:transposase [Clostridiales bacterium]